jgi:hypothetical protein
MLAVVVSSLVCFSEAKIVPRYRREAPTVVSGFDDVAVVGQAIEQRGRTSATNC